jgi:hypothetical protein
MESTDLASHDRRSFLAQLGKTLSVGLGLGLVAATSAEGATSACAITCYPVSGSCSSACCSNPPCATHLFHCYANCGYNYYKCLSHSCVTYCASNVC